MAVAQTGSFSKAASLLYVSQPNISSSITSLEKELGYLIFNRTNQGISLTEEGNLFIKYASNIMAELKKIEIILEKTPYWSISIETMFNHTLVTQAFLKLTHYYEKSSKLNFNISSNNCNDILENVYLGKVDLGILLVNKTSLDTYENTLAKKAIVHEVMAKMHLNITLSKNHPLLEADTLDFDQLHRYPHVNYSYNRISDFPDVFAMGLINPDKMISVSDSNMRRQLIMSTDVFGLGCEPHPLTKIRDFVISIPLDKTEIYLLLVYQKKKAENEEVRLFKNLLMEELNQLYPQDEKNG